MFTEARQSLSAEITNRLVTTLVARCSHSDFIYEIESLSQKVDATSVPTKLNIEFELVLRYAEKPDEYLIFHSLIENLNLFMSPYSIIYHEIDLVNSNVSDEELKERMIREFEIYSTFDFEFSIES